MIAYIDKTGEILKKKLGMFFYRGKAFVGLVSSSKALYDCPEDSFAKHVGIRSSLDEGLIRRVVIISHEEAEEAAGAFKELLARAERRGDADRIKYYEERLGYMHKALEEKL
jgi:hypothetical protein